ncbi:MAG TPA: SAM-dependent methyltransferase [Caulobacteraceae bacterium]|nr:SAM-dependent methyltransferase [Caulobacteraceae bacterium]
MRRSRSLGADYFEALYRGSRDPWDFETSDYERAKYADTLASLGEGPVRRALEMGCSIGVFTRDLATVCDRLVATDLSATALTEARRRCADLANVEFRQARSVADGLEGTYDLIILSEVVYYWDEADLTAVARAISRALAPAGRLLLVHWLGQTDYPRSADAAVEALWAGLKGVARVEKAERRREYRLDLWRRIEAFS